MIVISVILILVGVLVPVVNAVRKQAVRKLARSRLKGLCVALDRYHQQLGCYPPDTGRFDLDPSYTDEDGSADPTSFTVDDRYSLYRYLCGPGRAGVTDERGKVYGPYYEPEEKELKLEGAKESDQVVLLDPWGNPWVYEEHYSLTRKKGFDPTTALMHSSRYELFSVGPNGEMELSLHDFEDNDGDGKVDELDDGEATEDEIDDITTWSD
jgi:type II secretory pathway pseudopilin PulG